MSEYSEYLAELRAGRVTSVYEGGSTYGVYVDAKGERQYWHLCHGDQRASYALSGVEDNQTDDVHLIPVAPVA